MTQPSSPSRRTRLTTLEKKMLILAAESCLAGEWPYEENADRDSAALRNASEKLKEAIRGK